MMDIENIWQQSGGNDDVLNKMFQQKDFNKLHSKLPLKKLKKNLLIGIICAALITAFYVALFFMVHIWQVYIALVISILFNVWVGVDSWKLYKNINVHISSTSSLKNELQKNYAGFQRWWHIQEKFGLFVYPIGATGGFILGGVAGSGKPVEAFLYHPKMLLVLGVTLLILVPLCYYGARWMFNYAYGKHLRKLKLLIDELSN
ncbi:MAG: hypothetical protein WKF89_14360 [Chitinophagaceae bacterium]